MVDIVFVEDNLELSNLLKNLLQKKGFSLCCFSSGEEFLQWFANHSMKLLILDIMLPEMDGFMVCETVRKREEIPILILSARSSKEDQLLGFSLGADDYLEKPFDFDIFIAKIKAILKRKEEDSILMSGDFKVDFGRHEIFLKEKLLSLNSKEFDLLCLFLRNPGKTLYKNYIFQKVWGSESFSEEQTLTVHIQMLRSKIEKKPREPKRIITVWGVGYRYEEI